MFTKVAWPYVLGSTALLVVLLLGFAKYWQKDTISYIGIPDGAAGLLARYVLIEKMGAHGIQTVGYEPYTLYDCCASATQYAMGSGRLDIAIMCTEAASELVARDRRFVIAGPVMMNSDIFITRPNTNLHQLAIGVSQKRAFQRQMVLKRFGALSRAVPMLHAAVPFAYARGVVEGAVVDITKAFNLQGEFASAAVNGQDVCTYVMVIKKSLQDSNQYRIFLAAYGQAVLEMNAPNNLLRLLQTYVSADITIGDIEKWIKMNVRFTCPSTSPRQG